MGCGRIGSLWLLLAHQYREPGSYNDKENDTLCFGIIPQTPIAYPHPPMQFAKYVLQAATILTRNILALSHGQAHGPWPAWPLARLFGPWPPLGTNWARP